MPEGFGLLRYASGTVAQAPPPAAGIVAVLDRFSARKNRDSFSLWEASVEVSTGELAEILGIGERQVQSLAKTGLLKKLGHGRWDLGVNVQAFMDHRVETEVAKVLSDPGVAKIRDLRATEIELRIEERTGALIREAQDAAMDILLEAAGPLKPDMLSIPARVTKDLALRRTLEDEINGVFDAAAKRCAKLRREAEANQGGKR